MDLRRTTQNGTALYSTEAQRRHAWIVSCFSCSSGDEDDDGNREREDVERDGNENSEYEEFEKLDLSYLSALQFGRFSQNHQKLSCHCHALITTEDVISPTASAPFVPQFANCGVYRRGAVTFFSAPMEVMLECGDDIENHDGDRKSNIASDCNNCGKRQTYKGNGNGHCCGYAENDISLSLQENKAAETEPASDEHGIDTSEYDHSAVDRDDNASAASHNDCYEVEVDYEGDLLPFRGEGKGKGQRCSTLIRSELALPSTIWRMNWKEKERSCRYDRSRQSHLGFVCYVVQDEDEKTKTMKDADKDSSRSSCSQSADALLFMTTKEVVFNKRYGYVFCRRNALCSKKQQLCSIQVPGQLRRQEIFPPQCMEENGFFCDSQSESEQISDDEESGEGDMKKRIDGINVSSVGACALASSNVSCERLISSFMRKANSTGRKKHTRLRDRKKKKKMVNGLKGGMSSQVNNTTSYTAMQEDESYIEKEVTERELVRRLTAMIVKQEIVDLDRVSFASTFDRNCGTKDDDIYNDVDSDDSDACQTDDSDVGTETNNEIDGSIDNSCLSSFFSSISITQRERMEHMWIQIFNDEIKLHGRLCGFRLYKDCFVGKDAVDMLSAKFTNHRRASAVRLGRIINSQLDLFESVSGSAQDLEDDYFFYRLKRGPREHAVDGGRGIVGSYPSVFGCKRRKNGFDGRLGHSNAGAA